MMVKIKVKQSLYWYGENLEGYRMLRHPEFKTIGI